MKGERARMDMTQFMKMPDTSKTRPARNLAESDSIGLSMPRHPSDTPVKALADLT